MKTNLSIKTRNVADKLCVATLFQGEIQFRSNTITEQLYGNITFIYDDLDHGLGQCL